MEAAINPKTCLLAFGELMAASMAQVVVDCSDDDETEDHHLFVDWKTPSVVGLQAPGKETMHIAANNVVCLDSDSDSDSHSHAQWKFKAHCPRMETMEKHEENAPVACAQITSETGSKDGGLKRKAFIEAEGDVELDEAATKRKKTEDRVQKRLEDKQRRVEEKEAEKKRMLEERALHKQEKEEKKKQQQEENRKRREAEKLRKAEVKAKAAETRRVEQEKEKWEKGKFALQNTVAMIDCKVVESGLIGGQLLSRLAEKAFKYHLVSNPIERSIIWKLKRPLQSCENSQNSEQLELEEIDVPYVLLVFEPEEFSSILSDGSLDKHLRKVQTQYPGYSVCYLVNKLKWYLHKKDQAQYRHGDSGWVRPNADKALAELLTNYTGAHSRLCLDEADVADHIVTLTRSLAECPFKQKLTSLSVSKNGDHIVKNDPNKEIIRKNIWLKALVAIPKVSGAAAIAISKKYPTFRSLLNVYLDPGMTVHQKELLLQDLQKEGLLNASRRVGSSCSRRIYRILMAQNADLKTEDVEMGADLFDDQ